MLLVFELVTCLVVDACVYCSLIVAYFVWFVLGRLLRVIAAILVFCNGICLLFVGLIVLVYCVVWIDLL